MTRGQNIEWYTDAHMISSIVEDMAANVGLELLVTASVHDFIAWVQNPPTPDYTTEENKPVMLESYVVIIHGTTFNAFKGQAAYSRRQIPATQIMIDEFGNEIERATHGPIMLLSSPRQIGHSPMLQNVDGATPSTFV